MKPLKLALILTFSFFLSLATFAQDPEFTQYYAAPVYTNPALAGTGMCAGGGRVALNYRNQWPSLPGTFITSLASYDQHFDKIGGGVALMVMDDRAGEGLLTSTSVSGVYSYQLRVNPKFTIRMAIEGSFGQRSLDWNKLRFEDQIDPELGFIYQTSEGGLEQIGFANFGTGILAYNEKFYGGFAVHNLIEPNQSLFAGNVATIPRRFTAHGGLVMPLGGRASESSFSPNVLFMQQAKFTQMNLGFYYNKGPLVTGMWFRQTFGDFRNSDAIMALIGFKKDKFKFGYSFDFTVSDARTAAPGSHEISATIDWCAKKRNVKYPNIPCPTL
jgi:type IX secretion system PorP/SprF family membrane protein